MNAADPRGQAELDIPDLATDPSNEKQNPHTHTTTRMPADINGEDHTVPKQSGVVLPDAEQVLKILGWVVAPTTALTALMYYFGLLHAYWFLQTFGVDYTVMEFTTQDYLLRSADGLFVPLTVAAGASLIVIWISGSLPRFLYPDRRARLLRLVPHTAMAAGILLLAVAVVGIVYPLALQALLAIPGLALAGGTLSLTAAVRIYRSRTGAARAAPRGIAAAWEWTAVFLLVTVGLFWAAADYSASVGSRRGNEVLAALPRWPDAVIYAERDLNLSAPGVVETVCGTPESAYRYRYDGLKLILQSGDHYLFLPEGWTRDGGTAFVIPRTDALRLDFSVAARGTGC